MGLHPRSELHRKRGIFGVFSFIQAEVPAFKDPLVAILPRLFIGIVAWLVFVGLRGTNVYVAAIIAGILGTLTNTVGVLGMATIRGYFPADLILTILPQVIMEVILAAIITAIVVKAVDLYRSGRTTAPEIAEGEERRY